MPPLALRLGVREIAPTWRRRRVQCLKLRAACFGQGEFTGLA